MIGKSKGIANSLCVQKSRNKPSIYVQERFREKIKEYLAPQRRPGSRK
jgi:hypothetical protein